MRFSKLCLIVAVSLLAATQLAVAGPWERNAGSKTMGDYTGRGRVKYACSCSGLSVPA